MPATSSGTSRYCGDAVQVGHRIKVYSPAPRWIATGMVQENSALVTLNQ